MLMETPLHDLLGYFNMPSGNHECVMDRKADNAAFHQFHQHSDHDLAFDEHDLEPDTRKEQMTDLPMVSVDLREHIGELDP